MFVKKWTLVITSVILNCISFSTVKAQKSVFIISKHSNPSHAQAYAIDGNELTYQADVDISTYNTYDQGAGAVGNAVWPQKELMFVTYESSPMIVWASTKTLQKVGEFDTDVTNLSGIAVDEDKEKIYVVRRYYDDLYVYSFDDVNNTLVLDNHYDLVVPSGSLSAWGIALDETNDLLYISTNTKTVHVYDTSDWSHDHPIDIEVGGTDRPAVGIAVDPNRGYLYTGHWEYHNYLVRTDTASPYTSTEVEIEGDYYSQSLIGVDVDEETGLVYCTTYHNDFRVYDSNLSLQDTETNDIYRPAGVAVGGLYKPPFPLVVLVKDDNDVDCAYPWNEIDENYLVYNICYYANGYADTNVFITDYLPDEVNYISSSSDPCGIYDPCKHTVTWIIGDMSASDSNTFWIQVGVNYYAKPGHKIFNLCEIESDEYYTFVIEDTNICCYGGDIIYVDADANGFNNGTSWLDAYEDLQDALHTARTCGCEQIWVAKQTYKPTDMHVSYNDTSARSISFELVNNVAVYGGFPPGGGTWTERNPNVYETILSGDIGTPVDQNDNSYHVVKCQDVNNATLDGFIITAGMANGSDAHEYGGGIYCWDSYGLIVRNCSISLNSALFGGAIFNYSCDPNITNCIFFENTAEYDGGGIYNYQSSPSIINCTFSGNSATTVGNSHGGAIYNTTSSDPNVTNCIFSNNSASEGGAVYNYYDSDPNIINCVFNENTADGYGGGMVNSYQSSPTIINCTFSGNSATTVGNSYGGAICNWDSSDPNISNCIFTANDANMGGGLYNNSSSPNMTNCIFAGNTADSYGGGMFNYYESYPVVVNSIFSGNRADIYGGGIGDYNSSPTLTNCTLIGNSASYGGGMYNYNNSSPNLTNCILWGNVGTSYGDEIYNYPSSESYPNISYSDIKASNGSGSNWVVELGTDVGYNIDEDPCFFEVEQPDGSWTENASYDNSTFQSTLTDSGADWAVNELAGKFVSPNTPQLLQFFIVSNNVSTIRVWSDVTAVAEEGDTYYIFDYHLRVESACIDRGDPNGDYTGQTDIDGEPRVFDGDANGTEIVDMGADEYYWSPADFNSDGFVNFFDYAFFASAWQTDPNDPNYNEDCDLEDNNFIDYKDIALFCEDWLWQTAWAKAFPSNYGRGMGKSMGMGETFFPSIEAEKALPELTAADIEEILKWLAELWLTDEEVRKMITEDEWLKFTESVKQVLKELINN